MKHPAANITVAVLVVVVFLGGLVGLLLEYTSRKAREVRGNEQFVADAQQDPQVSAENGDSVTGTPGQPSHSTVAQEPSVEGADAVDRGMPLERRHRSLTELGIILEDGKTPPSQKVAILVAWLEDEVENPRPTLQRLSAGWVGLQITKGIALIGNPKAIENRIAGKPVPQVEDWFTDALGIANQANQEVRDWLSIALGLAGGKRVVPRLIEVLQKSKEGFVRAGAAEALGDLGAKEAIPALEEALGDRFCVEARSSLRGTYTDYPVSRAARGSLSRIRSR